MLPEDVKAEGSIFKTEVNNIFFKLKETLSERTRMI